MKNNRKHNLINTNIVLRLFFLSLLTLSFYSCDKIKSLNSNKTTEEKSNKNIPYFSLDNLVKKNKDGQTIYVDENSPKFSTKDCFYPYLKKEDKKLHLYLKLQHLDVEPLNITSYIITANKVDYQLKGSIDQKKINGKKKYTIEILDKEITTTSDLKILKAIAKADHVEMVLVGENRFIKKTISKKMQLAFKNILGAYIFIKK